MAGTKEQGSPPHVPVEFQRLDRPKDYAGASGVERRWFGLAHPEITPQTGGVRVFEGNAGGKAGVMMVGGALIVKGNCGDDAGCGMVDGTVLITGTAGRHVGNHMYGGCIFVGGRAHTVGHRKDHYVEQGRGVIVCAEFHDKDFTPKGMWVITNHVHEHLWHHVGRTVFHVEEDNLIVLDKSKIDVGRRVCDFSKVSQGTSEEQVNKQVLRLKEDVLKVIERSELNDLGRYVVAQSKGRPEFKDVVLAGVRQMFEVNVREHASLAQKLRNWANRYL